MQEKTEIAAEVIGASAAQKATMAGASAGVFGWVTQINWIGASGVIIAVVGLLVNVYFQHRRDRREAEESRHRIRMLAGGK